MFVACQLLKAQKILVDIKREGKEERKEKENKDLTVEKKVFRQEIDIY
jgi:hypothetical protein